MAALSASSSRVSTFISLPWLTSPDHLQLRTTLGPTSGNEVVPRSLRPRVSLSASESRNGAFSGGRIPFVLRDFDVGRPKSVIRAALFAARCRVSMSQSEEETMA